MFYTPPSLTRTATAGCKWSRIVIMPETDVPSCCNDSPGLIPKVGENQQLIKCRCGKPLPILILCSVVPGKSRMVVVWRSVIRRFGADHICTCKSVRE